MRQGDGDIDWYRAYRKLKMRFDETSKMLEEQSELNKKLREQLSLCSVVVSEAELKVDDDGDDWVQDVIDRESMSAEWRKENL